MANYTNIPPGRYRFEVRASNADGVWNESGAALDLRLHPHFYRTTWFYLAVALGVIAAVFFLYRMRLQRLRGEFLAVFAERNRVARELHDSLLQGMAAAALELGNVRDKLAPSDRAAANRLEAVEDVISSSLVETRRLVWNLRDDSVGSGDLGQALWRLAGRLTDGRSVTCSVDAQGEAASPPPGGAGESLPHRPGGAHQRGQPCPRPEHRPAPGLRVGRGHAVGDRRRLRVRCRAGRRRRAPATSGCWACASGPRSLGAQLDLRGGSGKGTAVTLRLVTNGRWHADA